MLNHYLKKFSTVYKKASLFTVNTSVYAFLPNLLMRK